MKRISLFALIAFAFALAIAAATPHAQAGGLFGSKPAASPTPTPVPSALPTASPEPPSVAIPKLEAKLKANPNDQQSAAALAAQFLQVNRPDLAVQLTQRLLQSGDKTAQVFYYDGYAQQTLGNAQAALFDFENASNLDPTNMGILAQLAEMYLKANRPADAERVAKRAVTFNKGEPGALMELGSVYAAEGHFDDARAQFEAAYQLNVKDVTPIFQIATTYAQQNNLAMAVQTIDRALAIDPKNLQALVYKADIYAKQNDETKAVAAYDDAVVAAPSDDQKVAVLVRKAGYFVDQKKYAQADAVFQQITTTYPKIAGGFVAYGDYYASQKQYDKAAAQWQAALAIDPDNAQSLLNLGQISLQSEQGHRRRQLPQALHASIAGRARLRAARAGVLDRARLSKRARRVRQELRDSASARNAGLRRGCRFRTAQLQGSGDDLRGARQERARVSSIKTRRCCTWRPSRSKAQTNAPRPSPPTNGCFP